MAYYDEIKIASAQTHELGCMSMIYVINITSSCIIPTFVGSDIYTLNYRDWFVIKLMGISHNICNGSPRYLELNQMKESGN